MAVPAHAKGRTLDHLAIFSIRHAPPAVRIPGPRQTAAWRLPVPATICSWPVGRAVAEPIPAEPGRPTLAALGLVLPGAAADGIVPMCTLPPLADLPVIFVSTYGQSHTVARPLEAGAADQIVKPFSPAELVTPLGGAPNGHAAPGPFLLAGLAIDRAILRVAEQD